MRFFWIIAILFFINRPALSFGQLTQYKDNSMTISSGHLSEEDLLIQLEEARNLIEIGACYAHYRNPEILYKVIGLSIVEATQEVAVVYQKQSGSLKSVVWTRPLSSWLEKVSVENRLVDRFQKI